MPPPHFSPTPFAAPWTLYFMSHLLHLRIPRPVPTSVGAAYGIVHRLLVHLVLFH
jgi:hypothetical protein